MSDATNDCLTAFNIRHQHCLEGGLSSDYLRSVLAALDCLVMDNPEGFEAAGIRFAVAARALLTTGVIPGVHPWAEYSI